MLLTLAIRDIVLIDRLDLEFASGLGVLTGETGAGKSILLDALGLALGSRGDAGLIRPGAVQASVAATFDPADDHPARRLLDEQGLAQDKILVLRRVLSADGRSRAFVNDEPVGVALLRRLGQTLVEVHGQNDEQGLLDAATHRSLLDAFGGLGAEVAAVREAHAAMASAAAAAAEHGAAQDAALREADYLRHVAEELGRLKPLPEEEDALARRRAFLMQGEKLAGALGEAQAALGESGGMAGRLRMMERVLGRFAGQDGQGNQADLSPLAPVLAALERVQVETAELETALTAAARALDLDPAALERVEERLFALRAAARKHGTSVAGLAEVQREAEERLAGIEDGGARLATLTQAARATADAYGVAARRLGQDRAKAAARLDKAVAKELPPLKLGAARFATQLTPLDPGEASPEGMERVMFRVATNPGTALGPLARIASGGELSRFMLALKVVLAASGTAATLVFDEVDHGIGGATADAVGERLAHLAERLQVLVVTHSPQVAARAAHHWHIAKSAARGAARTAVAALTPEAREEEIARMLAGATITDQARAAARRLLEGGAA